MIITIELINMVCLKKSNCLYTNNQDGLNDRNDENVPNNQNDQNDLYEYNQNVQHELCIHYMSTTCEHHKSESPPPLQTVKAQFTLTRFGSSRRSVGAGRGRRLGRWRRRIRDHRGVDRLRHLGRVARRHHLHVLLVLLVELLVLQPGA